MKFIKQLFAIEANPKRGLMALEWLVLAYATFTLLITLFTFTTLPNPEAMIWGRVRAVAMTLALWLVYRLVPCRPTRCVRVVAQMSLLAWWYPDTYEINRMFPNLDHVFCHCEQQLFGFQPAISFVSTFSWPVFSELMSLGYTSYYPMIALTTFFYFVCRYNEFERASFVVLASFFIFYVVFIFVPVAGPTFYYKAVGMENIMSPHGSLPLITRRHRHRVYAARLAHPQPSSALRHGTLLRAALLLHGVHPGTLRHRRFGWSGKRHTPLRRPDVGDKKAEVLTTIKTT